MDDDQSAGLLSRLKAWWVEKRTNLVEGASVPIAQLSRVEEAFAAVQDVSPEAVRRLNRDAGLDRSDEAIGTLIEDEHGITWEPWGRYRSLGLRRFGFRKAGLAKVSRSPSSGAGGERMRVELTSGSVLHVHIVKVPEDVARRLGSHGVPNAKKARPQ